MKPTALFFCLLCSAAMFAQPTLDNKVRMSIPGVKGVLELNVGLSASETRVRPDGLETQMQAMHRPDGVKVSAFLQKVDFPASAEKCRDEWWASTKKGYESGHVKFEHLTQTTKDGIARVEFFVQEFRDKTIRQQTVHAYLGARDLCAEVHLSKQQFVPEDQKLFEAVLASARLLPEESATPSEERGESSFNYLAEGSKSYFLRDYAAAIRPYQKAVELEKQKRTLNRTQFIVLVDNLGYAYAVTGDIPKSMDVLRYGITQEADYPLFHYNLACGYGELSKMDESLEELRLTFKYKANMLPGEPFPDPLKDSSFKKFLSDKKFVEAVRQMQRQ